MCFQIFSNSAAVFSLYLTDIIRPHVTCYTDQ